MGRLIAVGLIAVVAGGCARNSVLDSQEAPGAPEAPKGLEALEYTGISAAAKLGAERTLDSPRDAAVSAWYDPDTGYHTKVTFNDGPLAGRSFDVENDRIVGGLNTGETAFLETIGNHRNKPTMLVGLNGADTAGTYALYSPSISDSRPSTGTASFEGDVVANGYSPTGKGLAEGKFSIMSNFGANKVIGTISDVKFRDNGSFPDIHFTADYDANKPNFYADTLQLYDSANDTNIQVGGFHLEGVTDFKAVDQTGVTRGAFSVKGGETSAPTEAYGLTGVFHSQLKSYTPAQ